MEEPYCSCPNEFPTPDYTIVHRRTINDGRRYMIACRNSLIIVARTNICPHCGRYTMSRIISTLHNQDEFFISMPTEYMALNTVPINRYFAYSEASALLQLIVVNYYGIMIKYDDNTLIYFNRQIIRHPGHENGHAYLGMPILLAGESLINVGAFMLEDGITLLFINEFGNEEPYYVLSRVGDTFRNAHIIVSQTGDNYQRIS